MPVTDKGRLWRALVVLCLGLTVRLRWGFPGASCALIGVYRPIKMRVSVLVRHIVHHSAPHRTSCRARQSDIHVYKCHHRALILTLMLSKSASHPRAKISSFLFIPYLSLCFKKYKLLYFGWPFQGCCCCWLAAHKERWFDPYYHQHPKLHCLFCLWFRPDIVPKFFFLKTSYRIFRHMHEPLNIDKKESNCPVGIEIAWWIF